ncbi:MAG TPA: methyltransferase domain-containing protein [Candidatus Sulfotelmatobacter sp.]|nr:methyltransferase domain-containing protein [Candidatus Sulfotelmatobacter sp.]
MQRWDPASYERNARFVADMAGEAVAWLDPQPGERILDLGCGDGALTARLASSGAELVGFDASSELLAAARARGLDVREGDAHALPFLREFSAVFSNAALHWMQDPDAVLTGIARALRPGGRFVAEFGGHGNVAAPRIALDAVLARRGVDAAALMPWYLPTPDEYRARLEAAGFVVERIVLQPRLTPLPGEMADWLETFAQPFLAPLAPADRAEALAETVALLRPVLCDAGGRWTADYVRLRVRAHRN